MYWKGEIGRRFAHALASRAATGVRVRVLLDGIGFFFIQSLNNLDLYAVMAYLLVTAIAVVVFNLIADILYGYLDTRIRYD